MIQYDVGIISHQITVTTMNRLMLILVLLAIYAFSNGYHVL